MYEWRLTDDEKKVARELIDHIEEAIRGGELGQRLQLAHPDIYEQLCYELMTDGIAIEEPQLTHNILDHILRVAVCKHPGWSAGVPRALVEAGADPKLRVNIDSGDPRKTYPILGRLAAIPCCDRAVKAFIAAGADVNERDYDNGTPLHLLAADSGASGDGISALIAAGADIEAANDRGRTPLHYAAQSVHPGLQSLLDAGANVQARDRVCRTPLHWAAFASTGWVMGCLIKAGAELDAQDDEGKTPLHWASRENLLSRVEVLVEAGANIHAVDNQGREPGDLAEHPEIQAYLRRLVVRESIEESGAPGLMGPFI